MPARWRLRVSWNRWRCCGSTWRSTVVHRWRAPMPSPLAASPLSAELGQLPVHAAFKDFERIFAVADAEDFGAGQSAHRDLAPGRLPGALHRAFPAPMAPGSVRIQLRLERRTAIVADPPHRAAQSARATARLAITPTRWARYSALAWMSLFNPSGGVAMFATAFGEKLALN